MLLIDNLPLRRGLYMRIYTNRVYWILGIKIFKKIYGVILKSYHPSVHKPGNFSVMSEYHLHTDNTPQFFPIEGELSYLVKSSFKSASLGYITSFLVAFLVFHTIKTNLYWWILHVVFWNLLWIIPLSIHLILYRKFVYSKGNCLLRTADRKIIIEGKATLDIRSNGEINFKEVS
jgi:hypothetical protein